MSDYSRITGLASGMDTENMIKELMKAESQRMVKVERDKQLVEWEQEEYRTITKMLREFRSSNFDILSPTTNFRSPTMFAEFSSSITSGGVVSDAVTVIGNADISKLSHTINNIDKLATKDIYESTAKLKTSVLGTTGIDFSALEASIGSENDTLVINLDGISKTITLSGGYDGLDEFDNPILDEMGTAITLEEEFKLDFQAQIDEAFGEGKIAVSFNGIDVDGNNILEVTAEPGHQTTLIASDPNILSNLGFTSGDTDYIKINTTLADAFDELVTGTVIDFSINGVSDFGITSDDTLKQMMDKVNGSGAGVTMSYSGLSGKISIQSNGTGEVNKINFTDTDGFLANQLQIDLDGANGYSAAQDAEFTIDNVATSRSSNSFTIDGANYTLNRTTTEQIDISLSPDTDGLVEKITDFVEKYNLIVEAVNSKLSERKNYDYKPLSDDEKEAMSEDEIELWESRAKSGLLSSSNELRRISTELRTIAYEPIEGLGMSLRDIGITTSTDYKENGKLIINEEKLRDSINNDYSKVVDIFTKKSDIDYDDTANRAQRKVESGFANRIYDILQDNVRTTRDANGNKGVLLEKAGIENDTTEFNNYFNNQIKQYDNRIDEMLDYLDDRENYYYQMFAQMEKAMTEMQTQASWLQGNMG